MPNPVNKTRPASDPYAIFTRGEYTFKVLRIYTMKSPAVDPFGMVYLATVSPYTMGDDEYGDGYLSETIDHPQSHKIKTTPEFEEYLRNRKK